MELAGTELGTGESYLMKNVPNRIGQLYNCFYSASDNNSTDVCSEVEAISMEVNMVPVWLLSAKGCCFKEI